MSDPSLLLRLSPRRTAFWLAAMAGLLALAQIVVVLAQRYGGLSEASFAWRLTVFFDLMREYNIPTLFSVLLLWLCAALLALIGSWRALCKAAGVTYWKALAALFVYLSLDEALALHELTLRPLRVALHAKGFLRFAWVVPAMALVAILAVVYWRFVWGLPARTRALVIAAGMLYVGGALGFEMLGGKVTEMYGGTSLRYRAVGSVEEVLEMAGLIVFIYAMLDYMRVQITPMVLVTLSER